eukprot:GHVS01043477.1.p1 GENE.GHVS01043477.1~~GHVS01043477.1.p1  ORF type:complete len:426 (+),score=52.02 GHVS01043477.1:69-1346(+)
MCGDATQDLQDCTFQQDPCEICQREREINARFKALYDDAKYRKRRLQHSIRQKEIQEKQMVRAIDKSLARSGSMTPQKWEKRWKEMVQLQQQAQATRKAVREQVEKQRQLEELKECTFVPKVSVPPSRRTHNDAMFSDGDAKLMQQMCREQQHHVNLLEEIALAGARQGPEIESEYKVALSNALMENEETMNNFLDSEGGQKVLVDSGNLSRQRIIENNGNNAVANVTAMFKEKRRCAKLRLSLRRLKCLYELTRLDNLYHQAELTSKVSAHGFDTSLVSSLKNQEWYQAVLMSSCVGESKARQHSGEPENEVFIPAHRVVRTRQELAKLDQATESITHPPSNRSYRQCAPTARSDQRTIEAAQKRASPSSSTHRIRSAAERCPTTARHRDTAAEAHALPSTPAVLAPVVVVSAVPAGVESCEQL